jgi:hypothetical protein
MRFGDRTASAATLGAAMLVGASLAAPPAEAAYVVTLEQDGPNVVATGSGTIDLAGLSFQFNQPNDPSSMDPSVPEIVTGATGTLALYEGSTGPTNFGSGGVLLASSASGDLVALDTSTGIGVPAGYLSGGPLSDSATYDNTTLASLGVTPGKYVWTWGSGANADSFTLIAAQSPSPRPGHCCSPASAAWRPSPIDGRGSPPRSAKGNLTPGDPGDRDDNQETDSRRGGAGRGGAYWLGHLALAGAGRLSLSRDDRAGRRERRRDRERKQLTSPAYLSRVTEPTFRAY